eukprot:388771-Hanusia_phi.AAC.2
MHSAVQEKPGSSSVPPVQRQQRLLDPLRVAATIGRRTEASVLLALQASPQDSNQPLLHGICSPPISSSTHLLLPSRRAAGAEQILPQLLRPREPAEGDRARTAQLAAFLQPRGPTPFLPMQEISPTLPSLLPVRVVGVVGDLRRPILPPPVLYSPPVSLPPHNFSCCVKVQPPPAPRSRPWLGRADVRIV